MKKHGSSMVDVVSPEEFRITSSRACLGLWGGLFAGGAGDPTRRLLSAVSKLEEGLAGSRTKIMGHEFRNGDQPEVSLVIGRLAANGSSRSNFLASVGSKVIVAEQMIEAGPRVGVFGAYREEASVHVNVQDPFRSALAHPNTSQHAMYPSAPVQPADQVLQAAIDLHFINRDIIRVTRR